MSACSQLKAGDEVIRCYDSWGRRWERTKVEKVGKIHITVDGTKFRMSGGSTSYRGGCIMPFDQAAWNEHVQEVADKAAVQRLGNVQWQDRDIKLAHAVCALLDAADAAKAEAQ